MKTRIEQVAEGLANRIDQINGYRDQQPGCATSLYVHENLTSEQYRSICDTIHGHYDKLVESSNKLAYEIRNS